SFSRDWSSDVCSSDLGLGLSGYGHRLTIGAQQAVQVPAMDRLDLGALSRLEILGPILFNQPALIYVGLAAAPLLHWFLYRTAWRSEERRVGKGCRPWW